MNILKLTGVIASAILLITILSIVLLIVFVTPDRFKPIIIQQVKKNTGRELIIDGKLSWTLFPYLGVKTEHLSLSNPPEFKEKTFAEVANATVGVKLLPLWYGRIESSGIHLTGMKLYLLKNANGQVNWVLHNASPTPTASTDFSPSSRFNTSKLRLSISSVDVSDASITWIDEQVKKSAHINHLQWHASNINVTHAFPMTAEFDFSSLNPVSSGHITLSSQVAFNFVKQIYSLRDIDCTADIQQNNQTIHANMTGDMIADLTQQTIQWTQFKAKIANLNLTGAINVSHLTSEPEVTGHMLVPPFDLRAFLQALHQPVGKLSVANDMKGEFDFSSSAKSTVVSGNFSMPELQVTQWKISDIVTQLHVQDGVVTLAPITANLYQGKMDANAKITTTTPEPQISLAAKLNNVQVKPLLEDLGAKDKKLTLSGLGTIDLQVTTLGTNGDAILNNLNGTSHFNLTNGTLEGVDIGFFVDTANALVNHQSLTTTNTEKTDFGNLTGTAVIHNGVVNSNDLLVDSPRFTTKGNGNINLVNQQIDYVLQASVKQTENQKNNLMNLYGLVIPIRITGNLGNPSIRIDIASLIKTTAQQQLDKIKSKAQEQLQQNIKEKIPEEAGKLLQNLLGN